MRYKITIEYDGTNYCGWQKQHNKLSIQQTIEDCIFLFSGEKTEIFCSGRTDAGVHAIGQVAHFDLNKQYKECRIVEALNYYLCKNNRNIISEWQKSINNFNLKPFLEQDIAIKNCEIVDENFHARFSSKMRSYKYIILNRKFPSALWQNRAWYIRNTLNIDKMQECCNLLLGNHDFSSFRDSECQAVSPIKTISSCNIYRKEDFVIMEVKAKSFLHHMIRNIIGTLRDVGTEKTSIEQFKKILDAKDRKASGINAPACGLYFVNVEY